MDYARLAEAITPRTKAVIPVDVGGAMCDYDRIFAVLEEKKGLFCANNHRQAAFDRVIVIADAAHSLGATYNGERSGAVADFSCFSFHAVKNLTTAEGGAITWKKRQGMDDDEIYRELMLYALHGPVSYTHLDVGSNSDRAGGATAGKANGGVRRCGMIDGTAGVDPSQYPGCGYGDAAWRPE